MGLIQRFYHERQKTMMDHSSDREDSAKHSMRCSPGIGVFRFHLIY